MAGPPICSERRKLVLTTLSGAALLALGARDTIAQAKMTRERAQYQDEPKGILMCGTCSLFLPPAACKVVEGYVAVTGWCNAFDLAD
ncbi:MAG: iron oxidase [Alphaproteobacteria bacterium]